MFHDYILCYKQIGTHRFEAKRDRERFIVVFSRCGQNQKIGHFVLLFLSSTGEKCTEMCATRAARSFFPFLANNIAAFWRCRSRRCFLNSLMMKMRKRKTRVMSRILFYPCKKVVKKLHLAELN